MIKLGRGVTHLKEGQRVVGVPWPGLYGVWQQYRSVPADVLVSQAPVSNRSLYTLLLLELNAVRVVQMPVSDKLSDELAAQIWVSKLCKTIVYYVSCWSAECPA